MKRSQQFWDDFFLQMAYKVALLSKDPARKVGSLLVSENRRQISMGYNGFPENLEDWPVLLEDKAFKLKHIIHAEINALNQAPFNPRGCSLYVTACPCEQCAKEIINRGVSRVIIPSSLDPSSSWYTSWLKSLQMFKEHQIEVLL